MHHYSVHITWSEDDQSFIAAEATICAARSTTKARNSSEDIGGAPAGGPGISTGGAPTTFWRGEDFSRVGAAGAAALWR